MTTWPLCPTWGGVPRVPGLVGTDWAGVGRAWAGVGGRGSGLIGRGSGVALGWFGRGSGVALGWFGRGREIIPWLLVPRKQRRYRVSQWALIEGRSVSGAQGGHRERSRHGRHGRACERARDVSPPHWEWPRHHRPPRPRQCRRIRDRRRAPARCDDKGDPRRRHATGPRREAGAPALVACRQRPRRRGVRPSVHGSAARFTSSRRAPPRLESGRRSACRGPARTSTNFSAGSCRSRRHRRWSGTLLGSRANRASATPT